MPAIKGLGHKIMTSHFHKSGQIADGVNCILLILTFCKASESRFRRCGIFLKTCCYWRDIERCQYLGEFAILCEIMYGYSKSENFREEKKACDKNCLDLSFFKAEWILSLSEGNVVGRVCNSILSANQNLISVWSGLVNMRKLAKSDNCAVKQCNSSTAQRTFNGVLYVLYTFTLLILTTYLFFLLFMRLCVVFLISGTVSKGRHW